MKKISKVSVYFVLALALMFGLAAIPASANRREKRRGRSNEYVNRAGRGSAPDCR